MERCNTQDPGALEGRRLRQRKSRRLKAHQPTSATEKERKINVTSKSPLVFHKSSLVILDYPDVLVHERQAFLTIFTEGSQSGRKMRIVSEPSLGCWVHSSIAFSRSLPFGRSFVMNGSLCLPHDGSRARPLC